MAVVNPIELVIDSWEGDTDDLFEAGYWPTGAEADATARRGPGHKLPFSRVLYIERGDFAEEPRRLAPPPRAGKKVRLRRLPSCSATVDKGRGGQRGACPLHARGPTRAAAPRVRARRSTARSTGWYVPTPSTWRRALTIASSRSRTPAEGDVDHLTQMKPEVAHRREGEANPRSRQRSRAGTTSSSVRFFVIDDTKHGPVVLNRTVQLGLVAKRVSPPRPNRCRRRRRRRRCRSLRRRRRRSS